MPARTRAGPCATPGILWPFFSHSSTAFRYFDSTGEHAYLDTVPQLRSRAGSVVCTYCQWCVCCRWGCGWAARNVGTCVHALTSACQSPYTPPLEEPRKPRGFSSVLVSSSGYNKNTRGHVSYKQHKLCSLSSVASKSKISTVGQSDSALPSWRRLLTLSS